MKRKLTRGILTLAAIVSLNLPAFATSCRPSPPAVCGSELLLELLLRCGCGELPQRQAVPVPEQPAEPERQTEQEQKAEPEQPAQPEQPAEAERPADSVREYEREVLRLVNVERERAGLAALSEDETLARTARLKSQDMRDKGYFDHNSPTYGTPFRMLRSFGVDYRTAGENIAMGYATPQAVVAAWMASPGHRANILNASYTRLGVGYVPQGHYWTQHFTG